MNVTMHELSIDKKQVFRKTDQESKIFRAISPKTSITYLVVCTMFSMSAPDFRATVV